MNYSGIKYADMINGPGIRVSLFVSGCSHCCKGCFNVETWNPLYGKEFTDKEEDEIISYFKKYENLVGGLSILGGDPTYAKNIAVLISFLTKFKKELPNKSIWLWSGYSFEEILEDEKKLKLISLCDVLVDGKFELAKKNLNLKWRGSSNQRVIDIRASLASKKPVLYEE